MQAGCGALETAIMPDHFCYSHATSYEKGVSGVIQSMSCPLVS